MRTIKDKISKLLALGQSPEPAEAKAALLRARELMAKHKLRPEDFGGMDNDTVIKETVGVECTKMTDSWAAELSAIVAEHYCCISYHNHAQRSKTISIGFIGLRSDFNICKQVYLYAYDCIKAQCVKIKQEQFGAGKRIIRRMCNVYGWGFCRGLIEAYKEQTAKHQEWGLVMVIPDATRDAAQAIGEPKAYTQAADVDQQTAKYDDAGYQDGRQFDPARRLTEKDKCP